MTVFHEFSTAERDSVLAGLRLLQLFNDSQLIFQDTHVNSEDILAIPADGGEPLNNEQLDNLIEELNW